MTWAQLTYGVWALVGATALFAWLASSYGWRIGGARIGRLWTLVGELLEGRLWLRMAVLAGWIWVGVHAFAR